MKHKFIKKNPEKLLIIFHGTGGDEKSLIGMAERLDNDSSVLSLRGNVTENGLNRFFKRKAIGVLDFENLRSETDLIYTFLNEFIKEKGFDKSFIILLGYSNGANMIGSLLLNKPPFANAAVLLRPMLMIKDKVNRDLKGLSVFVSSGKLDQLVSIDEIKQLDNIFLDAKANIISNFYSIGHEIGYEELVDIKRWYNDLLRKHDASK